MCSLEGLLLRGICQQYEMYVYSLSCHIVDYSEFV